MLSRDYRTVLYERYSSFQPSWKKETAQSIALWARSTLYYVRGWLPDNKNAKCLDLGCGTGRFLQALSYAGYTDFRGVDCAPQAIEIARGKGFTIIDADLRQFLRDSTDCYDVITAFDVIEHFGKDELLELVDLVRNRLTPNGRFIIQTPNASSPWASGYRYGDLTHELIFTPQCLVSLLGLVGFGDVTAREVGPFGHGIKSAIRALAWRLIWGACALWNLIETGSIQGGIYTRNMILLCVNNKASE